MRSPVFLTLTLSSVLVATSTSASVTGYYRFPTIHGDAVVFAAEGDLWQVPLAGGRAVRLTSHDGNEAYARFSPDGRWLAFSGQYQGNVDVYVMPAGGGEPRRLTYHPGADEVCDNGINDDCNASTTDIHDGDGDGWMCDVDCADDDRNNWTMCSTCVDVDNDNRWVGCNAYITINGPDNCPDVHNPGQGDNDGDGRGDACECDGSGFSPTCWEMADCSPAATGDICQEPTGEFCVDLDCLGLVLLYEFQGQREQLVRFAQQLGPEKIHAAQQTANTKSLDNLPGLRAAGSARSNRRGLE